MAKLQFVIALLLCLSIIPNINSQTAQQICPRFLCEAWTPLQNITTPNQIPTSIMNSIMSQFRTGLNPNSQICFQANSSTNQNTNGGVTQYFMHTCPYPNYFCGLSLVPPSTNGGAAVAQTSATCQLRNQTNLLNVGDWCYSNSDCYSGLCDNRNQGTAGSASSTNTAWATQLGLNVEWSNPFQQGQYFAQQNQFNTLLTTIPFFANSGTNKCFVRKYNESCSNHQQCGLGLRCATNPWQAPTNTEPTYICMPQLNQGSSCQQAGNFSTNNQINPLTNTKTVNMNSWELCPYGTACVTSGSSQSLNTNSYVCTTKFTLSNNYYFQFPPGYQAYQTYLPRLDNFQLPPVATQPVGTAQTYEMCASNVSQSISTTQFQCQTPYQSLRWQSNPCQRPTDCACTDQTQCSANTYLQQSCTCAIFNTNGSAFCKGFPGNIATTNGMTQWSNVLTQFTAAFQNYSKTTQNPSCYNYQLFDQMPWITDWLFPTAPATCHVQGITFGNPGPQASRPSCLELTFRNPMLVNPQAPWEIDMMEQYYGNGSIVFNDTRINPAVEGQGVALLGWIPYSPNQQNVPGGAGTRIQTPGTVFNPAVGDSWNTGTCPQWICQNVTTSSPFSAAQSASAQASQFSAYQNYFPVMRGACALYDPTLNQWSMRACRSTLDVCVPCLPNKCGGYANYSVNAANQAQGNNLGTFAFKCLRADGTKKRVFEDCWDDSDCLSQFCQWPGYCAVRPVGTPCFSNVNCDRNLQCVYNPTYGTQPTCQPAIIANGYCDQNTWQQCKFGSVCLQVTGEFYPRCVNKYSLPGQSTFQFIGIDLTTINNTNYAQMCSSGYYQTDPLNAPTFVNYTGCLITPPKTYGGWPKQCLQNSDCNSIDLVKLQGQVVNSLSTASNGVTNNQCTCDNNQKSPFWMGNMQGQMFCQGFDGERNDLQKVLRQSYERDFANCYPYEIQNAQLSSLGYLGGFCGQQIVNWYDPAPNRPIGACYAQWFQDVDILSRSTAFTAWVQSQGYSPANSFLYNLFSRCPVYTCQNSTIQAPNVQSQNSICRYFNVTTNQIQLFGCPAGQSCNEYNSTFWLCNWNPSLQKNLSQVCTFDVECVSQFCNPSTYKCDVKTLGQQCDAAVQCGQNLICGTNSSLYQGSSAQVLLNQTNQGTQCLTPLAVLATCKNVQQGLDMTSLCPYGTKCILTSNQTTSQNWQCIPYYSLGPAVTAYSSYVSGGNLFLNPNAGANVIINILQPPMTQAELNMMCQSGFYFQDPTVTSTTTPPQNTQQMGYCAFNKLWNNGKAAYQQQCMSNQDCVNNFNYTISSPTNIQGSNQWLSPNQWFYKGNAATLIQTYGTCSCQFINDQGAGWCQPMPSDQQELPGWTQFYAQGMKGCYPFEYLTGLNIQSTSCSLATFGLKQSVYANYQSVYTPGVSVTQNAFNTCIKQIFPFVTINSGFNLQVLPQFGYQYPTNYTTFCPAHQCLNASTNPFSICFQYTSTNVLTFQKCANSWDTCQFYNTTLGLCWNQTVQKNQGDNCMFNWQCRSNICSNNGTCAVATLNQSCTFHYNCDKNLRCSLPGVLNANIFMGKQCVLAIPNGGICQPWSFDQCKYGSSCILVDGQSQPICTQWYSLQGGSKFSLITNFSQYNNSQYHASMQSTFNQMCATALYDPVQGCRAAPEVTQGGWPKACQLDTDCNGARYGTPGVCTCSNANTQGTGYCAGFQDEQNNMTGSLIKNFQRPFTTCYPYEINSYFMTPGSDYTNCGRYDYATWHSAPGSAFGSCYPQASLPYWTGAPSLTVNFILAVALLILMVFKF